MNDLRSDPPAFTSHLEAMKPNFVGLKYYYPGTNYYKTTKEGVAAVQEAIDVLKATAALNTLEWSDELAIVCKAHVDD